MHRPTAGLAAIILVTLCLAPATVPKPAPNEHRPARASTRSRLAPRLEGQHPHHRRRPPPRRGGERPLHRGVLPPGLDRPQVGADGHRPQDPPRVARRRRPRPHARMHAERRRRRPPRASAPASGRRGRFPHHRDQPDGQAFRRPLGAAVRPGRRVHRAGTRNYLDKCFIFLDGKLTRMPTRGRGRRRRCTRRGRCGARPTSTANDVNPRPLSELVPSTTA